MKVMTITTENFYAQVLSSDKPVLLDFWADWCGPCRILSPVIEEIAAEREDIAVGKVNVDEETALAQQFGVMSIPTLILIKGGKTVATTVGVMPKADVLAFLEQG